MAYLTSDYFLNCAVPLIAVCASVFLKFTTRNDAHKSFKKEDVAFGLDVALSAVLLLVTASSKLAITLSKDPSDSVLQDKLRAVPWILLAMLVGLWGTSTFVRKVGWDAEGELRVWRGIVVPNAFGLAVLLIVVNWIP